MFNIERSITDFAMTPIVLGVQGDDLTTQLVIDVSEWDAEFPTATYEVLAQRSGEDVPYLVASSHADGVLTVPITATETGVVGKDGRMQISLLSGGVYVRYTNLVMTVVNEGIGDPGVAPEPGDNWLAALEGIRTDAEAAQGAAEVAQTAAEASATAAAGSATAAAEAATAAAASSTSAAAAKVGAENAQAAADGYASAAYNSAAAASISDTAAYDSATAAEASATAAETAQGVAESAAATAVQLSDDTRLWRKTLPRPVAQVYTVSQTPLGVTVKTVVKQAGSGDPSPDNIRAITGSSSAVVNRTGKNLFDKNGAGVLTVTIDTASLIATNAASRSVYIKCKPNTTYTVSKLPGQRFVVGYTEEVPVNGMYTLGRIANYTAGSISITTGSTAQYLIAYVWLGSVDTETADAIVESVQIEQGVIATDHEPYESAEITLVPVSALYGVTDAEDEIGNDGAETHNTALLTLNGSESGWALSSTQPTDTSYARFQLLLSEMALSPLGVSDRFAWISSPNLSLLQETIGGHSSAAYINVIILKSRMSGWSDAWSSTEKQDAFKTWLASNNTQMVYQLAAPTTAQGAAQALTALVQPDKYVPRLNNVFSDYGEVIVGYAEALKHREAKALRKIASVTVDASDVAAIAFTQDSDGEPLSLEEFEVHCHVPSNSLAVATIASLYVRVNDISAGYTTPYSDSASSAYFGQARKLYGENRCRAFMVGEKVVFETVAASSDGVSARGVGVLSSSVVCGKIIKVYLYIAGLSYYPVGTTITLYGRREPLE